MSSYALYYYDSCPFCQLVLRVASQLDVQIELRNTLTNPDNRMALQQGGGRTTVPCLLISDEHGNEQWMYESMDIARHLKSIGAIAKQV